MDRRWLQAPGGGPVTTALEPLLVDADGTGRLVGLSGRSIRRMSAAGLMPGPVRCGGAVRWRVAEIRAWVEAGCPDRDRWESLKAAGRSGAANGAPTSTVAKRERPARESNPGRALV